MITHHKTPYSKTFPILPKRHMPMPDFLLVFERQILTKTFRPIQSKEGLRIRNNKELQKLIKREDIVQYTTAQILKWLGYLDRMEDI